MAFFCSKAYNTLLSCHNFPAGSREATRIARICETSLLLYPRPTKLGFTLSVCLSVRPSVCRRHGFRSVTQVYHYTPTQRSWWGVYWIHYTPALWSWWGVYWIHLVRLSVCPSVCRRHGFRSVTQVCLGISISNFMCMLFVLMARSLLIFSDVTYKMAAWWPYWIFRFPNSNFSLALNIKSKLHWHTTCVYGKKPIDFQQSHFQNGRLAAILDFSVSGLCSWHGFWSVTWIRFGISISNFICMLFVAMDQNLLIFRYVTFKMAAWQPCLFF